MTSRPRGARGGLVTAALVLVAGCGGTAAEPVDAGATGADAAEGVDAGTLPAPADVTGAVALTELRMGGGAWGAGATADFYRAADFTVPTPAASVGACFVYTGGAAGMHATPSLDVGDIDVTGGTVPVHFALSGGAYAGDLPMGTGAMFTDASMLHLVAAGGADVPAFSLDVLAPPRIALTAPVVTAPLTIDRAVDLVVTWDPNDATDMYLEITGGEVVVACGAADSAGTLTVPAEALGRLPPVAAGRGMFMLTRTARVRARVGDATVSLQPALTECIMCGVR